MACSCRQEDRNRTIRILENLLLTSAFCQAQCRIRHQDGRMAVVSIAESSDLFWEVIFEGAVVENHATLKDLVDSGWVVE